MVSASVTVADIIRSFEIGSKKRSGTSGELGRMEPKVGSRKFVLFFRKSSLKISTASDAGCIQNPLCIGHVALD